MASYNEENSQIDVSQEEKDKLVAEVIRHVLFKTYQSSGCPIKREDLTQLITKNYRQRSLPALVINEARDKLSSIFGYEMKELQRSRPSSNRQGRVSQQGTAEAKSYVIVSKVPPDIYSKYIEDKSTSHVTGFTFVVISIVHLAGGKISEENLWHQLRRLGLNESDENHPCFGNTKQTLEMLVQQRYLLKEKVNGPEGNTVMYELAERALDESISEKLKDYIAQCWRARYGGRLLSLGSVPVRYRPVRGSSYQHGEPRFRYFLDILEIVSNETTAEAD
ncbi:melanoma-associated antigen 1 isoform X2 [Phoenix dactylifera]|nr:melanoma-associated antigen 1 isoform X2 [Phoenix dactylifera]XP_038983260.1 melanoma-associated antigen 1 isoform X2 [Phoenix dactylifera]